MRALRVGDLVRIIKKDYKWYPSRRLDVVEEAEYNSAQDEMEYSLHYNGAWYGNDKLQFIRRDGLKTLRKLCREED